MAGIHRSSTLTAALRPYAPALGMAGIHRSSTLTGLRGCRPSMAGDGRDSPLKYTDCVGKTAMPVGWGWPGFTAQVHCDSVDEHCDCCAGDGRDSPLKYTRSASCELAHALGMAGIHRSSTLQLRIRASSRHGWGWPGFTAQVHFARAMPASTMRLGMAGIHRSSTLDCVRRVSDVSWGWPGFTAQVHCQPIARYTAGALGMAGIHRSSTLQCSRVAVQRAAGDGRDSPLKYTRRCLLHLHDHGWGWPGFTAQVHCLADDVLDAGDGRDSPLKYTVPNGAFACWGWPGFTAQVH